MNPIRIGLTGSIGMGKSTITKQFRGLGFPVFDADEAVHLLYAENGLAVEPIRQLYPEAIINRAVSRAELTRLILGDSSVLPSIESIVHPLVVEQRRRFTEDCVARQELFVVYDIPLFFEKYAEYGGAVDYVVVVSCDEKCQEERVMRRPHMTRDKFRSILTKQIPDQFKREHADFVINTNYSGFVEGRAQLSSVLESILLNREKQRFEAWKTRPSSSIGQQRGGAIHRLFDGVVFDLDDTLCPVAAPLSNAFTALLTAMQAAMPKTHHKLVHASSPSSFAEKMKDEMHRVKTENPLIRHDLTEVRRRALHHFAEEEGEKEGVELCMTVFLKERSNIASYLYEDSIPCLQFLRSNGVKASILTNGNCDFHLHSENENDGHDHHITRFLHHTLTASQTGCSKPRLISFIASVQRLGNLPPSRILFVGDDHEKDILGASAAGMKTAFLVRDSTLFQQIISDENHQYHPKHFRTNGIDYLINNLQPAHLQERLGIKEDNGEKKGSFV